MVLPRANAPPAHFKTDHRSAHRAILAGTGTPGLGPQSRSRPCACWPQLDSAAPASHHSSPDPTEVPMSADKDRAIRRQKQKRAKDLKKTAKQPPKPAGGAPDTAAKDPAA
jgi:hypothetical protein